MIRAALIQMRSGRDMARNFSDAAELIRMAASDGARLIATPEMTNIMEPDRTRLAGLARPEAEDESVAGFSELARGLGIWLSVGSLALKGEAGRLVNRSLLLSPDGAIAARYDKIHLFDVDLPTGESLRESQAYEGGGAAVLADTPFGPMGLTICYDVRFPHLYRALARAGESVRDWSGGTRLGATLRDFNDAWGARGMARGAVVVVLSDGWDRGDPAVLASEMERLGRVAHRIVWVNPLKVTPGYAPLARGMAAALPHVDDFVEGHSLDALERLVEVLDRA